MKNNKQPHMSPAKQIIQHVMNKEPAQMKTIVNKEIASRVMAHIDARRPEVASQLFKR